MNRSFWRRIPHSVRFSAVGLLSVMAVVGLFGLLLPDMAAAQVVPSRTYQLQEYKPIAPAPPSNADRALMDVIRATNPYTGTVDRRVLQSPNVPIQQWPSQGGISANGSAIASPNKPVQSWPSKAGVATPGRGLTGPRQPIQKWPQQ